MIANYATYSEPVPEITTTLPINPVYEIQTYDLDPNLGAITYDVPYTTDVANLGTAYTTAAASTYEVDPVYDLGMPVYNVVPTRRLSVPTNLRLSRRSRLSTRSMPSMPLTATVNPSVPMPPVIPVAPALPFPAPMPVPVTPPVEPAVPVIPPVVPLRNSINAIPPYPLGYVDSSLNVVPPQLFPPPLYDPLYGTYGFGGVSPGLSYAYSPYSRFNDGALTAYSSVGGYGSAGNEAFGNRLTSPLCTIRRSLTHASVNAINSKTNLVPAPIAAVNTSAKV